MDSYFRTGAAANPDPQIALIAFDASTTHGGETNVPAETLTALLKRLIAEKPRAIGVLADLDPDHYLPEELERIASVMSADVPVFVGFTDENALGEDPPSVFKGRAVFAPGLVSRDSYNYGADSVSRRVMVEIDRVPTVYSRMAQEIGGTAPKGFESLGSSKHAYINWQGAAGTYPLNSAWRLLGNVDGSIEMQDKIVLIGHARRTRPTQDYLLTPFSRTLGNTSALEGAAHGLVTLIRDQGLKRLPAWAVALITLVVGLLTVNGVSLLSPIRGIVFMLVLLSGLWAMGWAGLRFGGWWLDLAHPMVMAIAAYYLVVPFRLGAEYRKRWHYQQKTEMMAQVEKLKTNFLSLVSHDLKTPIARIQGNAELLLREGGDLGDKQRKNLGTIIATTEHMSDYVETVLDLTRLESDLEALQKVSRDINQTIMEVLEEKRFLAAEKNIRFETELEPLFSFKYDVRLMRRVIANLIENAIRYSPENTTVTVSSKDTGHHIAVSIRDEGIGIPLEEQEKVFAKFYRGEGPVAAGSKGTGLGLYLVKYFVELHKGGVALESSQGKGSVFTVSLPV